MGLDHVRKIPTVVESVGVEPEVRTFDILELG